MDSSFRKILRPVDGRGMRGVFSRGKPIYYNGTNSPRSGNLQEIAKKRLAQQRKAANGARPGYTKRPS